MKEVDGLKGLGTPAVDIENEVNSFVGRLFCVFTSIIGLGNRIGYKAHCSY